MKTIKHQINYSNCAFVSLRERTNK